MGADPSGSASAALASAKSYADGLAPNYDQAGAAATVQNNLAAHTGNTLNPHSVTKSQVGLGSVPNVATNDQTPTYSQASALANLTSGEKLSVAFGKIMKAIADFITHKNSTSNPHGVTAAQVGADPTGTAASAISTHNGAADAHTSLFSGKSDTGHTHDDRYYTESETDTMLAGKAASSHNHSASNITSGTLSIARGGTGAASAAAARTNIGAAERYSGTATLTVAGWTGTAAPFTQAATCSGILATDTPTVDCVTGTDATAGAAIVEAWGLAVGAGINPQTSAGTITFYASEKPAVAIPFRWEGTR